MQNCFVSYSEKGYSLKRQSLTGIKFFPFRVDPFQNGPGMQKRKKEVT